MPEGSPLHLLVNIAQAARELRDHEQSPRPIDANGMEWEAWHNRRGMLFARLSVLLNEQDRRCELACVALPASAYPMSRGEALTKATNRLARTSN